MNFVRGFRRSKEPAVLPPRASSSAPPPQPTPNAEYVQVVASPLAEAFKTLQEMFPDMKVETIDEVLINNNAALEQCIDECLARQAQDDEGPPPSRPNGQTRNGGRYPQTPQAPRAAPFIHPSRESSPSPSSSSSSWSSLLREMLGESSTRAKPASREQSPPGGPEISKEPNPSGSRLISYDSVASDFAAVDDNSDFGGKQVEDKEGGVGLEGNDAWDDWFGSKVDVPGHTGEVIVPPADPSEVYSMTRHDSLVDEGGSPKKTERLCKVSKD